jgi:alpha-tubulin suppressor-like RCC1 family protein
LAWGRNYFGQLCNDDTSESEILPVEVVLPEDTTIVKIECFFEHTVAITGTPSV